MSIFNIVPVEYEGMSVITMIVFFFVGVGTMAILKWTRERFETQDDRLEEHDKFVRDIRGAFADNRVQCAEMKGSIEKTQTIVDRIDHSLSDIVKTNNQVLGSYLRRQE